MKRIVSGALFISLIGCAPSYAWGDEDRVQQRLIGIVPVGSSVAQLDATAEKRGWKIDRRNIRSWPAGSKTYMDDTRRTCRSLGGTTVPTIIAHYYAPFETYVEALWLFDPQQRLGRVCVRKTVDAL